MRQKHGTRKPPAEKVMKDIRRQTRKHHSAGRCQIKFDRPRQAVAASDFRPRSVANLQAPHRGAA